MEASLATDSEWVIIRGPNFVSTFLFHNFREMDIESREKAFDHLYLMCQFEVGSRGGCDLGILL